MLCFFDSSCSLESCIVVFVIKEAVMSSSLYQLALEEKYLQQAVHLVILRLYLALLMDMPAPTLLALLGLPLDPAKWEYFYNFQFVFLGQCPKMSLSLWIFFQFHRVGRLSVCVNQLPGKPYKRCPQECVLGHTYGRRDVQSTEVCRALKHCEWHVCHCREDVPRSLWPGSWSNPWGDW